MLGPTGIGVLYGKRDLLEAMPPFMGGGDMIRTVGLRQSTWNDLPWKFEAGTPAIAEAIGLGAAVDYLNALGMKNVQQHEQELTHYAMEQLQAVPGLTIYGPDAARRGGVISFTLGRYSPARPGLYSRPGGGGRGSRRPSLRAATDGALWISCHGARQFLHLYNTGRDRCPGAGTAPSNANLPPELISDLPLTAPSCGGLPHVACPPSVVYKITKWRCPMSMDYREYILDHYRNPRNYGTLEAPTAHAEDTNPLCGDQLGIDLAGGGRSRHRGAFQRARLRDQPGLSLDALRDDRG